MCLFHTPLEKESLQLGERQVGRWKYKSLPELDSRCWTSTRCPSAPAAVNGTAAKTAHLLSWPERKQDEQQFRLWKQGTAKYSDSSLNCCPLQIAVFVTQIDKETMKSCSGRTVRYLSKQDCTEETFPFLRIQIGNGGWQAESRIFA